MFIIMCLSKILLQLIVSSPVEQKHVYVAIAFAAYSQQTIRYIFATDCSLNIRSRLFATYSLDILISYANEFSSECSLHIRRTFLFRMQMSFPANSYGEYSANASQIICAYNLNFCSLHIRYNYSRQN